MNARTQSFLRQSIRRDTIRIRVAIAFLIAGIALNVFIGIPLWLHWLDVVLVFWGLR